MKYLSPTPRSFSTYECIVCNKPLKGRKDKKYCSLDCKNSYHLNMRYKMRNVIRPVDRLLHRNLEILNELWQEAGTLKFIVAIHRLERKGFKFNYYTSSYQNLKGKYYFYVYNFKWMKFGDEQVMIVKRQS